MLPLGRKPLVEWLVEEAVGAGIPEIVLVSSPAKVALEYYFETLAEIYGFQPKIICQASPRGTADALLTARQFLYDSFLVYYADEIWLGEPSRAQQLSSAYEDLGRSIVPVVRIGDPRQLTQLGVVDVYPNFVRRSGLHRIRGIVEKPEKAPSDLAAVSGMVLTSEIFPFLEEANRRAAMEGREAYLTEAIDLLAREKTVYALELTGEWICAGSLNRYPEAFIRAAVSEDEGLLAAVMR